MAERRRAEQAKLEYKKCKETNQELKERYTQELARLAQECGLLPLAEAAALERGGCLTQQVSYYLDTGFSTNSMQKMVEVVWTGPTARLLSGFTRHLGAA